MSCLTPNRHSFRPGSPSIGYAGYIIITSLLLAGLLCLGCPTWAEDDLDDIRDRGTLRHLGIPYANFVTGSGDGLDMEVTRLFADYLGVRHEFVESTWSSIIPDLIGQELTVSGNEVTAGAPSPIRGDMIATGMTILPWREKAVHFSLAMFPTQVWLMAPAGADIRPIVPAGDVTADIEATLNLVKGRTVLGKPATCIDPQLYSLDKYGAKTVHFTGGPNELAPALMSGEADLTLLDIPDALIALEKWPGQLKVIGPVSQKQCMGCAFRKSSPELAKAFQAFFLQLVADGTYEGLVRKYYPSAMDIREDFFTHLQERALKEVGETSTQGTTGGL